MDKSSKHNTAFTFPGAGLFEFQIMPFSLCHTVATFQRLMDEVLQDLVNTHCLVYLDDFLVVGTSKLDLFRNLRIVLERLARAGLTLNTRKCQWFCESIHFLGHVVSNNSVQTEPAKIAKVRDWPTPKSSKDIRSFLGLAS